MSEIVDVLEGHFYAPKNGIGRTRLVHWVTDKSVCFSDGGEVVSFVELKSEFEKWAGRDVTEGFDFDTWRQQ